MASISSADVMNNNVIMQETSLLIRLLPVELMLMVLGTLDFRTLLICKRVCRLFRHIIAETAIFQYKIELGVHGMEDGPPGGFNVAVRLDRLKRRQAAWCSLKWTEDKSIEMLTGRIWELYGGVLAQATGRNVLSFQQLPSHYRGIAEKSWTVDISQIDVRDFTFDNSQDLLVIAEKPRMLTTSREIRWRHTIQLRHLSTGAAHSLAPTPASLIHILDGGVDPVSFSLQISGSYLGVLFISGGERENELVIWNWKTGRIQMNLYGTRFSVRIGSFAYLSDRYIVVAAHICPVTHELQPNLLVFDLTTGPITRVAIGDWPYVCSFFCPSPGPWTVALDIGIQSDPAPSNPSLSVPFFTGRENRMFVVTILLTDGHTSQTFVVFIPWFTLTKHITALTSHKGCVSFPWEAWGPHGTRMISSPGHSNIWVCYVYGMRFVAPHEVVRGSDSATIRVYDFNPLPIKRAIATNSESDEDTCYVTMASSLYTSGTFEDIITTSLPYSMSQVSLETNAPDGGKFGAVMCSEDNLIVVGTGFGHRQIRVLTF